VSACGCRWACGWNLPICQSANLPNLGYKFSTKGQPRPQLVRKLRVSNWLRGFPGRSRLQTLNGRHSPWGEGPAGANLKLFLWPLHPSLLFGLWACLLHVLLETAGTPH
jgi:hypothetical protein